MKKWLCPPFVYWRCWFLIARLHSMFASLQVWTTKNCWYLLLKACCSSTWARGAKLKFVWGLSRIEHVEDVRSQHQKAWPCLERFLSVGCDRNIQLDWPLVLCELCGQWWEFWHSENEFKPSWFWFPLKKYKFLRNKWNKYSVIPISSLWHDIYIYMYLLYSNYDICSFAMNSQLW